MQLTTLYMAGSLSELKTLINIYFGFEVRLIRVPLSIFEQYDIRPKQHRYFPGIWRYKVVARNKAYHFGKF